MRRVTIYPPYAAPFVAEDTVSVKRLVIAMAGFALIVSAVGLWLAPSPTSEPSFDLMKLGISLFMLLSGAGFLTSSRPVRRR
ncbi:MAG: hypothetical protein MK160_00315 [Rhodobacteraceae bacterium]|nr:hypothetical protein [Paracoccaceae bacterium]